MNYQPLEIVETFSRVNGRQWWVRDEEEAHFFVCVEIIDRRLTCGCPDGEAHSEAPDTEPPCVHLRAVVDERQAAQLAKGPPLGVLVPSLFCD
jgi:hypothetical protein